MFDQWPLNRFEQILSRGPLPPDQRSVLAGVSRSLRISHLRRDTWETAINGISAGLIGPLAYLFVWWVLHQAKDQGIRRLYFLARDGQLFLKVAKVLIEKWGLDLDARYLYCSRESLLLPSFQRVGFFEENWITWGYLSSVTLEEICRRLEVNVGDLSRPLEAAGLSRYLRHPRRPISPSDRRSLHDLLQRDDFAAIVREKSASRFEVTHGYLQQEGLADDIQFALVDTGWRGSSQYALSSLLDKGKIRPRGGLTGFYIGLNRDAHCYDNDIQNAFLFDWRKERRDDQLYNFLCFEMLSSADHGRTIAYHHGNGRIEPTLQGLPQHYPLTTVITHHETATGFARRASTVLKFHDFHASSAYVCRKLAREFICRPTPQEAEVYGEWPIGSEIRERDCQEMAPPLDWRFILACTAGRTKIQGFWPQASMIRGKQHLLPSLYNLFLVSNLLEWYRRCVLRY